MSRVLKVINLSITMEPRLAHEVRSAAKRAGVSVSAWLADAAATQLRRQVLTELLAEGAPSRGDVPMNDASIPP